MVKRASALPLDSPLVGTRQRVQTRTRLREPFSAEDLERFKRICGQQTDPEDYPLSETIAKNAVVYDGDKIRSILRGSTEDVDAIMGEMHHCLLHGPGVYVVRKCYWDRKVIDTASAVFETIIEREKRSTGGKGDHFAPAGNNDRIWNSFQKHAEVNPVSFVEYYSNEILALASESWLGPGYQVTAQTNIVRPGGKAQNPHRDYHLGFQSESVASRFPIVSQVSSQLLTLQGAVAHSDMPLKSGPTKLLPFSQQFDYGYIAYRHPGFTEIFDRSMIQLELNIGDAIFFNPALFHAAGENVSSDIRRSANLVQISACWSRPMETIDRAAILRRIWPAIRSYADKDDSPEKSATRALLSAVCDGYSFPTNLDTDPPPANEHCPPTQFDNVSIGLQCGWPVEHLEKVLAIGYHKRQA